MAITKRLIQPFFNGYINKSSVEDNILDGPFFSVTPRPGKVSYFFFLMKRNVYLIKKKLVSRSI